MTWFATLVPMAAGLKNVGFLDWLAKSAGGSLVSLDPTMAVLGLLLAFCLLRYFFASGTAYVTAMVGLFATLILQIPGVDPAQVMLILLVPMGIWVSFHHMVQVTAQSGLLVATTKVLNSGN